MLPRYFSSSGIILATRSYSEADRIIVIFSRNYGKLTVIAKGVRRPKSKKGRNIEIFNHIKFSVSKGKALGILAEVEIINAYETIRKDLNKATLSYYFCEIIGKITEEEERNENIYHLLLEYLDELTRSTKYKNIRYNFVLDLLVELGYWPHGKKMENPDNELEKVLERNIYTKRVGKKILH